MSVTHLKFRAVKQESDGGLYRVSVLTGAPLATINHRGDLLLTAAEWEVLSWVLTGSMLPEGVYGRVLVDGALPPRPPYSDGVSGALGKGRRLHERSCPAYYPGGEYTGERCTCGSMPGAPFDQWKADNGW